MPIINTTIYSCPNCKQRLPASTENYLKVMGGALYCQCLECGNYYIIQKGLKCGYCKQRATHVRVGDNYNTRSKTYRYHFYCDEHAAQSAFQLTKEIFLGAGILGILLNVLVYFTNPGPGSLNGLCLGGTFLCLVFGAIGYGQMYFSNTEKNKSTTDNALEIVIQEINRIELGEPAEEYFKRGMEFIEKNEFNDAILEFAKVIRKSSPKEEWYQSAKKNLQEMGYSEADIRQFDNK